MAVNLKACNRFRLVNGRAAENELNTLIRTKSMFGADLIMHNLVVFRNGEGALNTLPKLVDVIPEARLNLSIYYLRSGDVNKAQELTQMILKPTIPSEYILKGAVHTLLAQRMDSVSYFFECFYEFNRDFFCYRFEKVANSFENAQIQ